ncbi:hypothetical protein F5X99DRAFT_397980 [Biscogniauxia marginata]|nr:hypothetical protein F5X99DRAFT_397980 [Biscogniauxia marginata]
MAFQGKKDALRARLSRSKSTSHMLDMISRPLDSAEDFMENTAHEQTDMSSMRELSEFLRTTGPPSRRPTSPEDCLRFPGSKTNSRWSIQSLKRTRRSKSRTQSTQLQLPGGAVPETTADGHSYIAPHTTVKHKHHGPWFRSQYPVFVPSAFPARDNSHQGWPERTSSREASSSIMKEETLSMSRRGSRQLASVPSQRPSGSSRPKQGDSSISSKAAPASEGMSGVTLHAVNDKLESGISGQAAYPQLSSGLETPNEYCPPRTSNVAELPSINSATKSMQARKLQPKQNPSVSQTLEHKVSKEIQATRDSTITADPERDEYSTAIPPSHETPLATLARPSKDEVSLSVPGSVSSPMSPKSPPRAPKKPADIVVKSTLTVPNKEPLLPESPGFPNMLATLTFPSPPKSSRSPSPTNITNFPVPNQSSMASGPLVRPRISSRRARTSLSVPTVSLNEIIMRPTRPVLRHVRSEYQSRIPSPLELCPRTLPVTGIAIPLDFDEAQFARPCLYDLDVGSGYQRISPVSVTSSTTNTRHQESASSNYDDDINSYRQSLISNSTLSTSLYQQSGTADDSYCQSTRSDATELSTPTMSVGQSFNSETANGSVVQSFMCPLSVADERSGRCLRSSNPTEDTTLGEKAEVSLQQLIASEVKKEEAGRSDTPPTTRRRTQPRRAYFEARAFESMDSPVLGWFPENALRPSKSYLQGSSPLAHDSYRSSTPSVTTMEDEILTPERDSNYGSSTEKHPEYSADKPSCGLQEHSTHPRASSDHWTVSSVMTTNIAPTYFVFPPPSPTEQFTISPIMVVANLESRPGSSTLRLPHLPKPDSSVPHLPPRSSLRPKALKIIQQSRQKPCPITIARNPSTGAIERTASTNYRLNRRSLTNMPTPPLSPELGQSPGRMSLPLKSNSQEKSQIPEGQTSSVQDQEWLIAHRETEQESQRRSVALRERVLREKLQKEKEISDIVAKTVGTSQKGKGDSEFPERHQENHTTQCIERQLQRLERNGDAWLRAMKPFLENMAKTLENMRQDGGSGSLTMSEFNIDMEAEARRFSCYNHQFRQGESLGQPGLVEDFDGKVIQQQSGPQTDTIEKQETKKMANDIGEEVAETTRSLQEHELEAQAAIKRRLLQQEAMMSNLLSRWGLPSPSVPGSGDLTVSVDTMTKPPRRRSLNATGKKSGEDRGDSETDEELLKENRDDNNEVEDLDPLIVELRRAPWPQRLDRSSDGDGNSGIGGNDEVDSLNLLMLGRPRVRAEDKKREKTLGVY